MNRLHNATIRLSTTRHLTSAWRHSHQQFAVSGRSLELTQRSNLHSLGRNPPRSLHLPPLLLGPKVSPTEIRVAGAFSRSFHYGSRIRQETDTKTKNKTTKDTSAEGDGAKNTQSNNSESGEGNSQEGKSEGDNGGKKEDNKEAPPPPPPHGDKSPWQVFTETLQKEFQSSKEWKESTKALSDGAHQFTENESVRRAREAYQSTTGAVSSTTANVLKTTAGAVGKGAAWTWQTPVVKGVRSTVNATASVIEKGTRPIRETEAFKNVKNVIDDGSSSRYGGWVEKEERRKARELREMQEAQATGGKGRRVEVLKENPEWVKCDLKLNQ